MLSTKGQRELPEDGFSTTREKTTDNFTIVREVVEKVTIHVVKQIVPREEPNSPKHKIVSHKDRFTLPSGVVKDKKILTCGRFPRDGSVFPRLRDAYKVTSLRNRLTSLRGIVEKMIIRTTSPRERPTSPKQRMVSLKNIFIKDKHVISWEELRVDFQEIEVIFQE